MKKSANIDLFAGFDPDEHKFMTMDGYDDCIVGIVEQFGRPPIVCYSLPKVIQKLMADGMSEEEAEEFWSYNQIGAYVGDSTPCFLTPNNHKRRQKCLRAKRKKGKDAADALRGTWADLPEDAKRELMNKE